MTGSRVQTAGAAARFRQRPVALVDVLDRVLGGGVVIVGDVVLSIADVDLVHISLRALVASLSASLPGTAPAGQAQLSGGTNEPGGARELGRPRDDG